MPKQSRFVALAALLGACVPIEEATIQRGMIHPRQSTLLLVYAAPGPWVMPLDDTKMENAAKFLPGLGMVVQSAQDDHAAKASDQLKAYLPPLKPEAWLYPALQTELGGIGFPGVWVSTGPECEITPELLGRFNRAQDTRQWRERYLLAEPASVRAYRNYSTFLSLDDSLILEVNVQPAVLSAEDGVDFPALSAVSRLYRAGTMKLLWSHEDAVSDRTSGKFLQEFMAQPQALVSAYEKLAPQLAQAISANLKRSVPAASTPAPGAYSSAVSTAAVSRP
jgi:hypothetical protein